MTDINTGKEIKSPYLLAKQEWNERYGSYIQQRNNWRNMAFVAMAFGVMCLLGWVYQSTTSKFIPYVVAVDELGRSVAVAPAQRAKQVDDRVIQAQLARFITDTRSVTTDANVQKMWIFEAYTMINQADSSFNYLQQHYTKPETNPFQRAAKETVEVKISTVLRQTDLTFEVEWMETVRTRAGEVVGGKATRMRAILQIYLTTPQTVEQIIKNPAGVYIKDISWSNAI